LGKARAVKFPVLKRIFLGIYIVDTWVYKLA